MRAEESVCRACGVRHRFDFDAHDAFDDFRIGAVDRELQPAAEKWVGRLAATDSSASTPSRRAVSAYCTISLIRCSMWASLLNTHFFR